MQKSYSESYKNAGVDITAGYKAVELMRESVKATMTPGAISPIGGFGGLFRPELTGMKEPVLVSGTDGVGTKLKLAFLMDKHDTVGIDCVAMCANDVACAGAQPLFFLDYIALGRNVPERVADIVKGVANGCIEAQAALIGGETAEMPGFYPVDEYDLAGFCVGIADREKILDRENVEEGDVIIALPSSGVHSNGFSLVRRVFGIEDDPQPLKEYIPSLARTLGEALIEPTRIYVRQITALMGKCRIRSAAHITGGGFYENLPRALPDGLCARIKKSDIRIHPIFDLIKERGGIPERDMFNTFNMGVGMCVVVDRNDADKALSILSGVGENAYIIGEVVRGDTGVELC